MKIYNREELLHNQELFSDFYNQSRNEKNVILASGDWNNFETPYDFAFANTIQAYNNYYQCRNFGMYAQIISKTSLKWLLRDMFDNCSKFVICENEYYSNMCCAYYNEQIKNNNNILG